MELETFVFPQQDPLFTAAYNYKDLLSFWGASAAPDPPAAWNSTHHNYDLGAAAALLHHPPLLDIHSHHDYACSQLAEGDPLNCSSPQETCLLEQIQPVSPPPAEVAAASTAAGRRKRRRARSSKNKEEVENQRMTHIAVERNRRRQMNEYLAVLRSLMPPSYAQRGDQASIIGGAINYVKELEQHLHAQEAQRRTQNDQTPLPFADFFTFPQYSARPASASASASNRSGEPGTPGFDEAAAGEGEEEEEGVADVEVTMVESHANVKIRTKRRPTQHLKMVAGFESLRLTTLHLNITTTPDHMVLYCLSLKAEEGCQLTTVDDIAAAANQIVRRIREGGAFMTC